ncbi:TonB-dependent receptor, partial [Gemmatimonadota bacterium]
LLVFGFADYRHTEFEGDEVGTRFTNKQWEGRIELQHSLLELMTGSVGIQLGARDFAALGDEAFVPPADNLSFALFGFEELEEGDLRYQVGGRIEGQRVRGKDLGIEESHVGVSLSAGLSWAMTERVSLALSGARSVKLPSLEELLSNGPHAATFSFEIGNPDLENESAYSVDATLRLTEGRIRGELTGFLNYFDQFIFQDFTGDEEDGLPVLRFEQEDAIFTGAEASVAVTLHHHAPHHLLLEGWGDYVRAELRKTDQPLPRIPPLRLGGRLRWDGGPRRPLPPLRALLPRPPLRADALQNPG